MPMDEFEREMERAAREKREAEKLRDLGHELQGVDVGRQIRFLPQSASASLAERQKQGQRHATMTALQLLMLQDAECAASLRAFQAQLAEADLRLTQLHLEAEEIVQERSTYLEAIRAKAGTLDDGTRVYRDRHGAVFTEDGALLDAELRAQVAWQDGSPSLEEYRAAKDVYDEALAYRGEIETTQTEVDDLHSSAHDEHAPMQREEIENEADRLQQRMSGLESTRARLLDDPESTATIISQFNAVSPDLEMPDIVADTPQGVLHIGHQ